MKWKYHVSQIGNEPNVKNENKTNQKSAIGGDLRPWYNLRRRQTIVAALHSIQPPPPPAQLRRLHQCYSAGVRRSWGKTTVKRKRKLTAISRLKTKTISYTSIYFLLFVTTNAFLPRTSSQKKSNNETKNDECVKWWNNNNPKKTVEISRFTTTTTTTTTTTYIHTYILLLSTFY